MSVEVAIETSMMVHVEQILDGEAKCHCGKDAVLVVTSQPDGDPGPTCYQHGSQWIKFTVQTIDSLFGPKEK